MTTRRNFLRWSAAGAAMFSMNKSFAKNPAKGNSGTKPIVISTWKHGVPANEDAWKVLLAGGKALDAVEKGVMNSESDMGNRSVGLGGLPDRDGFVTLDACIMDEKGNCGSVCFLQNIKHPISVARMVMEKTPHIILVGEGALKFALDNGFKKEKSERTPESDSAWKEWLKKSEYKPVINFENHDTIGMISLDSTGNLSGACTTSGLAYKMHGRVGDSPIIGAGLFVDNEVGAATATGTGEEVSRIAVERISKSPKNVREMQIGFLALNKHGEFGTFALQKGFKYALYSNEIKNELRDSKSLW
jgi:isoaspartyl peptidase/L-asparaginase-like protein (Ntn-hydrolase superfamily)